MDSKTLSISGIRVKFPYEPYCSQVEFMTKVIDTLEKSREKGNCSALLESPTGSGKTLALLCAALAWQEGYHEDFEKLSPMEPTDQSHIRGGGFISANTTDELVKDGLDEGSGHGIRHGTAPKIFYVSRTHSQLSQVVSELRKSSYKPKMVILASRKQYCTKKAQFSAKNIDEECKKLREDQRRMCECLKDKNMSRLYEAVTQEQAVGRVHDIEDLSQLAVARQGCAYYTAQRLAAEASIVFSPYSYVLDPVIRRSTAMDIKGSILIFDEAHNIEELSREAVSFDISVDQLEGACRELGELQGAAYRAVKEAMESLACLVRNDCKALRPDGFVVWEGTDALGWLARGGIELGSYAILRSLVQQVVDMASSGESIAWTTLSSANTALLERLFCCLDFMLGGRAFWHADYRLVLQWRRTVSSVSQQTEWLPCLGVWCMNPAVAFEDLAKSTRSIILTSGTLSPMTSFASELRMQFEHTMEGRHIIDVGRQVFAGVVPCGPAAGSGAPVRLNASFTNAGNPIFQESLGRAILECCRVIPGGVLVFFPSYALMEKLRAAWMRTGTWQAISAVKRIFTEPRAVSDSGHGQGFPALLSSFFRHVDCPLLDAEQLQAEAAGGAVFFAVFRGKISEGINFANEYARGILLVGIPFPSIADLAVRLKKQFNEQHCLSRGLLSGTRWYCHQAFRAVNQAVGRCIRSRDDYGAILFLDERYSHPSNVAQLSSWLASSLRQPARLSDCLTAATAFFASLEDAAPTAEQATVPEQPRKSCWQAGCPVGSACLAHTATALSGSEGELRQQAETAAGVRDRNLLVLCRQCGRALLRLPRVSTAPLLGTEGRLLLSLAHTSAAVAAPPACALRVYGDSVAPSVSSALSACQVAPGEWAPEDGCVYQKLLCACSTVEQRCAGVYVAAANRAAAGMLQNVVLFLACARISVE